MSCRNWVSRTSSSQDVADRINLPSCSRGHISSPGASLHCSLGSRPAAVSTALCKASEMEMKMRTIVGALAVAALMAGAPAPASAEMDLGDIAEQVVRVAPPDVARIVKDRRDLPQILEIDNDKPAFGQPGMVARGRTNRAVGRKRAPTAAECRGARRSFCRLPFLSMAIQPRVAVGSTSSPIRHIQPARRSR